MIAFSIYLYRLPRPVTNRIISIAVFRCFGNSHPLKLFEKNTSVFTLRNESQLSELLLFCGFCGFDALTLIIRLYWCCFGFLHLSNPTISVYNDMEPDILLEQLLKYAREAPIDDLPFFIGSMAEAKAIIHRRLLVVAPTQQVALPQLVNRKEAAKILGVSVYYLEAHTLPCQTRAGRKVLYDLEALRKYITTGHIPFQSR